MLCHVLTLFALLAGLVPFLFVCVLAIGRTTSPQFIDPGPVVLPGGKVGKLAVEFF